MITPDSVDRSIFDSMVSLLESAEKRTENELKYMNELHNKVVNTKNFIIHIQNNKSIHYSNKNTILYNQLEKVFGNSDLVLDCFYKFKYNVGDFARTHKDSYSDQTSLLLLSDNFTGGEFSFSVNGQKEIVNFNKKGMFINFDSKKYHSVSKVLTGYRDVLVMLFKKKRQNYE